MIRKLVRDVERRGWPKLLLDPGDETFTHPVRDRVAFPRVIRDLEIMKRAGATTIMNHLSPSMGGEYGAYAREALRFIDIAMPGVRIGSTSPYGGSLEHTARELTERGLTTFVYSMSGQAGVKPDLSVARFSSGYFFYTLGRNVQGQFDYIFYRSEGNPYNPVDTRLWEHERLWFFPPQRDSDQLWRSRRSEKESTTYGTWRRSTHFSSARPHQGVPNLRRSPHRRHRVSTASSVRSASPMQRSMPTAVHLKADGTNSARPPACPRMSEAHSAFATAGNSRGTIATGGLSPRRLSNSKKRHVTLESDRKNPFAGHRFEQLPKDLFPRYYGEK